MRLANGPQSAAGDANEGDAAAVGRPFGLAVGIGAGVEIAQRLRGRVVDADEAVIAAAAHESDARAIGRPDRSRALAACLERLRRRDFAIDGRPPELALADEGDAVPARRDGGRADPRRSCGARSRPARRSTGPARRRSGRGPDWGIRRRGWRCLHARKRWRMRPGSRRGSPISWPSSAVYAVILRA